ncbi:kunitz/BPTI-like toxin [Pantherophis guttatus]|uniref:Kunitz/BPTI-like toxin n=1 Tax=Pantherophis guttatus TaxID=94885 RepID=A0ABM3ZK05_PANGU|nr:kunitz/BPTI-like toxin [Pantherophis guttatus]
MSSGGLLLLLGLLSLWAELTPVSGQDRPKFCYLSADPGSCKAKMPRFYYNSASKQCEKFVYTGCKGNDNNFKTLDQCRYTCVEKPGVCPKSLPNILTPCIAKCANDWKCPKNQKCCKHGCTISCRNPA